MLLLRIFANEEVSCPCLCNDQTVTGLLFKRTFSSQLIKVYGIGGNWTRPKAIGVYNDKGAKQLSQQLLNDAASENVQLASFTEIFCHYTEWLDSITETACFACAKKKGTRTRL